MIVEACTHSSCLGFLRRQDVAFTACTTLSSCPMTAMTAMTAIKEQPFQLTRTLSPYHVAAIVVSAPPVLREKLFACLDQESIELPMLHKRTLKRRNLFLAVLLLGLLAARPQTPARGAASGSDVISFLNKTLSWYHQVSTQQELVRDPADLVFLNDNRPVADQIVRLSF